MPATVTSVAVPVGREVAAGAELLVVSAMKMEHVVAAPDSGVVTELRVGAGDTVAVGDALVLLEPAEVHAEAAAEGPEVDPDAVRPDLAEVHARHQATHDTARPEAVSRRHATGRRTARENIDDLCDAATFVEYGPLDLNHLRTAGRPD